MPLFRIFIYIMVLY